MNDEQPAVSEPTITLTRADLVEGIRAVFYPRLPSWDDAGAERIERAVDRVLEAMGR